ncbi:NAD(P)/FAD-dependent oxidoreductase [uncultured Imperialibacter sp.]|uniref:NAD(P)/FAD-dependent oxidoreductase n=1 Tax=uncultured Imperialibacter sp. TaxID=1672639 RepID=UPI0030D9B9EC|tara:strand:- start:8361 stop:9476 length:1116 start_codon:yes stop_codon:yes gene_type:complete
MRDVIIIGGGLAGLVNSILLARTGLDVLLIEKKSYPFHRVCGEYISNEVVPFLRRNGLYPDDFEPASLKQFSLSAISGKQASVSLSMGGFGISRFQFDQFLYEKALESGVEFALNQSVDHVSREGQHFVVSYGNGQSASSRLVIGAHGKRSKIDKQLNRPFIEKRSPFVGVKYHVKTDFPKDLIALHNFPGGYCGISKVENDTYNVCYLSRTQNLKAFGSISEMEMAVLYQNPRLKELFENSDFLFDAPEVINEISFEKKETVSNSILMSGDSAGLITPLCGNGMAMAIHSAKILSEVIISQRRNDGFGLAAIEKEYAQKWKQQFAGRLWVGRQSQNLFGTHFTSNIGVGLVGGLPFLAKRIIAQTHGRPF